MKWTSLAAFLDIFVQDFLESFALLSHFTAQEGVQMPWVRIHLIWELESISDVDV